MIVRSERPGDFASIHALTKAAFAPMGFSDGTEPDVIDRLRADDALLLSLVAWDRALVGHVAFSPLRLRDGTQWCALGPISVLPDRQGQGIGAALIESGLARMRSAGLSGCILLGDPGFYGRFGFCVTPALRLDGAPSPYLQSLGFGRAVASGPVQFHPAFLGG